MLSLLIPSNVEVVWGDNFLKVVGPLGKIIKHKNEISLAIKNNRLYFLGGESNEKKHFYLTLLNGLIVGVSKGYRQKLKLIGVGYKAFIKNNKLFLKLGFSHEVIYSIPNDVTIQCSKSKGTLIVVTGKELSRVSQVTAEIRSYRQPDVYKGKGIHYYNEKIILKKGKRETK